MSSGTVGGSALEPADVAVIVIYFVVVIGFGLWSSLLNRGSIGGYFLAGRSMNFLLVGASLFASNIGSGHFIGLGGSGASSGIGISAFELNAMFVLVFLGWLFLPVYIASGVFTMPEYLRKRFGGQRIRVYLAVLAIILSIFTKVAADLYAGAIFIQVAVGWNLYASVGILLVIAALFTITGGLTAVIWTDFIQTIIMLIGAFYLMIYSFSKTGGIYNVLREYPEAIANETRYLRDNPDPNNTRTGCGYPAERWNHIFRPPSDTDLPWTGIIFGLTISSVWYWCSDQVIVQRALASRNYTHGKAGCILAGYLKFLPMWIIVFPGMISRVLFPDEVGCADPEVCMAVCEQRTGCTNIAYPLLVVRLMPVGARGLMLAVMMAALMSSLTSIFNSSATIFTMDIWILIRKKAKDTELMIVSRIFVLGMVAISIAWLPIVQSFSELFHYIQSVTSFLSPPICAVYVLAVFWKRTNEKGAFWGLMCGLVVGMTRFIWESVYGRAACGEPDPRPDIIAKVHYLHFGMLLFGLVFIITVVISLLTEPIPDENLERLIFWNRHSSKPRVDLAEGDRDAMNAKDDEPEVEETRCWKKSFNWICGIEKQTAPEMSEEEKLALEKHHTSLDEDPFWKKFCDINVIVMMTCACFIWGFFA